MNRRNRKMLLNMATGVAVAATAVVVFLPAAQAAPGVVTTNVNVRSGPGTNYGVVDTVRGGTQVDVQQCQGTWCYVSKPGPDGWISSSYISGGRPGAGPGQRPGGNGAGPRPGPGYGSGPSQPGIGINIPGGPQISIGGNQRPRPPVYEEPEDFGEVCFYEGSRFRGQSTCLSSGDSVSNLRGWADRISSIENRDGLSVQVCSEPGYRNCRTYTTSASSLGDFDDYIVSVRVR